MSIGTAYNSSTLPSGKTEAILVEGTNSGGVSTYLEKLIMACMTEFICQLTLTTSMEKLAG